MQLYSFFCSEYKKRSPCCSSPVEKILHISWFQKCLQHIEQHLSIHMFLVETCLLEILIPFGELYNCNHFIPQSLYYCGGPGERGLQISWSESEFFDKCLLRLWQYRAQCLGFWRQWLNNDSDKFFTRLSKLSRLVGFSFRPVHVWSYPSFILNSWGGQGVKMYLNIHLQKRLDNLKKISWQNLI